MKNKKRTKPRNEHLHDLLASVKPGKHKTGKKDKSKRRKDKDRKELLDQI